MDTGLALDAIDEIIGEMRGQQRPELLNSYATVKVLADELLEYARSHGLSHAYIHEKIIVLLDGCERMAGLEPPVEGDEGRGLYDALVAMKALRSRLCFGADEGR
jgi:hypothetical protein